VEKVAAPEEERRRRRLEGLIDFKRVYIFINYVSEILNRRRRGVLFIGKVYQCI